MILIRERERISRVLTARSKVHPDAPGFVRIGAIRYPIADVLELTNQDAINEILESEKKIKAEKRFLAICMTHAFSKFGRAAIEREEQGE
jgi:hypothetical protein